MVGFLFVVNLFGCFPQTGENHHSHKIREDQKIYLLGHISYIRIESCSIGICSVICLTVGHMLTEGGCQLLLAICD